MGDGSKEISGNTTFHKMLNYTDLNCQNQLFLQKCLSEASNPCWHTLAQTVPLFAKREQNQIYRFQDF